MHRPGHYGAALLVYTPTGFVALVAGFQQLAILGGVVAVLLAMLPDWDQRIPFLSHRGPTHSATFAGFVGLTLGFVGFLVGFSAGPLVGLGLGAFGAVVGAGTIASHLLADALTPMGVRPWWPASSRRYSYNVARADSLLANYGLLVLGAGVAGGAAVAGLAVA